MLREPKREPLYDSDEPIQTPEEDLLGLRHYACVLYELIRYRLPEDASFTIGIFGDWGTGKTSLMRILQHLLAQEPDRFVSLYFDAWVFEDFDNLFPPLLIELSKLAGEDRKTLKIVQEIVENIARVATARATEGEILWEDIKKFVHRLRGKVEQPEHLEYAEKISQLVNRITEGKKTLIIFLDDIDRVHEPSKVVNLLEDSQLLMDLPNVVYIIATSFDNLVRIVESTYNALFDIPTSHRYNPSSENLQSQSKEWAKKYLEKVIQLPVVLPYPSESGLGRLWDRSREIASEIRRPNFRTCQGGPWIVSKDFWLNIKKLTIGESFRHFLNFLVSWSYYGLLFAVFENIFWMTSIYLYEIFDKFWGPQFKILVYFWTFFVPLSFIIPLYIALIRLKSPIKDYIYQLTSSLEDAIDFLAKAGWLPLRLKAKIKRRIQALKSVFCRSSRKDFEFYRKQFNKLHKELFCKRFSEVSTKEYCQRGPLEFNFRNKVIDSTTIKFLRNNPRKLVRFYNMCLFYYFLKEMPWDENKGVECKVCMDSKSVTLELIKEWVIYMMLLEICEFENRDLLWEIVVLEDRIRAGKQGAKLWEQLRIDKLLPDDTKSRVVESIKRRIKDRRFGYIEKIEGFLHPQLQNKGSATLTTDFVWWVTKKWGYKHLKEFLKFIALPKFQNLNLSGVDFSRADLHGATFENCILVNANFEGANLNGVTFKGCDMCNANLKTDLTYTNFIECKNLENAEVDISQVAISLRMSISQKKLYELPLFSQWWTKSLKEVG